jgi:cytochrome c-type biogenesis protein CcmF
MLIAYGVEKVRRRVDPYTLPRHQPTEIESVVSREFAFLLNNWILVGMLLFILIATTLPLMSEGLYNETITVGPATYNTWMVPLGLVLVFLMGAGPLVAWRKATGKNLREAFIGPLGFALLVLVCHVAFGRMLGFPAVVTATEIYETTTGRVLGFFGSLNPVMATTTMGFALGAIFQEFYRGTTVRMRNAKENGFIAFIEMFSRARRRYGGYIVHLGIVALFMGFLGAAYDVEREGALNPGETLEVNGVTLRYDRFREESDINREMIFADLTVSQDGQEIGHVEPAKFIYRTHPDMPTTEVAIRWTPLADLYVILSQVDQASDRGTFRVIYRPLVFWIWLGGAIMLLGVFLSAFPSVREILGERTSSPVRVPMGATASLLVLLLIVGSAVFFSVSRVEAQTDSTSSLHAGTVEIHDPAERQIFERLLCQCGDCARLPLSTCSCGWAENMRAEVRAQIAEGALLPEIQADYRSRFGAASISVPSDSGLGRAMWAVPFGSLVIALPALYFAVRRMSQRAAVAQAAATAAAPPVTNDRNELDTRLDDELSKLDDA